MKIIIAVVILMLAVSCKTLTTSECQRLNEQLNSENRLLNRKITLVTRQNSVYVEENLIYKRALDQKSAQLEKLKGDMESMERKLRGDIALLEGKYQNLLDKNRILEAQSNEKIRELAELNKQIERKLGDEIAGLGAALRKNAEDFGREKEQLMLKMAQSDYAHAKESEEYKKAIAARETELSDQKTRNAELVMKLGETARSLEDMKGTLKNLEAEVARLREAAAGAEKKDPQVLPGPRGEGAKETPGGDAKAR